MDHYLKSAQDTILNTNYIHFENLHSLFKSRPGIVTFCVQQEAFKPGTGHFQYIYDLKKKRNQTIKWKFDYLNKRPIRHFLTTKFSIGCAIDEDSKNTLLIELHDPNDLLTSEEIKKKSKKLDEPKFITAQVVSEGVRQIQLVQITVPNITPKDEVLRLQKLFVDNAFK